MATPQIYKAMYSGVPVYELRSKGTAVMRRQSDSYVNATQILKVAEFDKPQRTRILERQVQKGEHEKIQGGYGKFQGTWVPLRRAEELSKEYKVHHLLEALFDFVPGSVSPPPAPKHATAASNRPRKPRAAPVIKRKQAFAMSGSAHASTMHGSSGLYDRYSTPESQYAKYARRKRARTLPGGAMTDSGEDFDDTDDELDDDSSEETYAKQLFRYFMRDNVDVPEILINKPRNLDINMIIDEEGHTSLHWAAAKGDLEVVEMLIDHDADMSRVNYKGQTALMRSVLVTNNYNLRHFETLLDMLVETVFNIDKEDQTVFHHAASIAEWKGKVHASHYYMENLLACLKDKRSDLVAILNVQDIYGDTALTIAARLRDRLLVRLLVNAGASPAISNTDGMTAQDYMDAIEENSHSSQHPLKDEHAARERLRDRVEKMCQSLIHPHAPTDASTESVSNLFDSFAGSYERDLSHKELTVKEAKAELNLARQRLIGTQHIIDHLTVEESAEGEAISKADELEQTLRKLTCLHQKESLSRHAQEATSDLAEPSDVAELIDTLSKQLETLQESRRTMVEKLLALKTQAPSKRYQEYKWLISMCCNVAYENVDVMLSPLLASFHEESPEF